MAAKSVMKLSGRKSDCFDAAITVDVVRCPNKVLAIRMHNSETDIVFLSHIVAKELADAMLEMIR